MAYDDQGRGGRDRSDRYGRERADWDRDELEAGRGGGRGAGGEGWGGERGSSDRAGRDEYDAGRSYGGDGGYGAGPGNEYRGDPRQAWGRDRYDEHEGGRRPSRGGAQQEWGGGYGGGYGRSGEYGERGGPGAWGGQDSGRGAGMRGDVDRGATYGAGGGAGWGTTGSVGAGRESYPQIAGPDFRAAPEPPRRGSFAGRGPRNYRRSDARIEEDVCEALTRHPDLDATDLEVHVAEGEVTLSGSADSRQAKRLAEDIAESVSGVRDVANQIRVSRNADDVHRAAEREVTRTAARETGAAAAAGAAGSQSQPQRTSGRTATSRAPTARDASPPAPAHRKPADTGAKGPQTG